MTDNDMLDKIRALLAKAESTPFSEEAKTYIAKAQELMTKYQIDEALLSVKRPTTEKPTMKIMVVEKPYAAAKVQLLASVLANNNCRVVLSGGVRGQSGQKCYLFGFPSDIETSLMLYTSLEVQAVMGLVKAHKPEWEHGKTFSNNFLISFASVINSRLRAAKEKATREADDGSLLPVLRDRSDMVDDAVNERFSKLSTKHVNGKFSAAGYAAGANAGRNASLGGNSVGTSRGALSR